MFETLLDCLSKKQSRKGRTALKWANVRFNNPHQAWRGIQAVFIFRFLGTHISADLTWTQYTNTLVKKA